MQKVSSSLKRILRLRELAEEISRKRLQLELRQAARVEAEMAAWDAEEQESRNRACGSLEAADHDGWLMAEAQKELARWQVEWLRPSLDGCLQSVQVLQGDFLERRTERRQVEMLIQNRVTEANALELRREQMRLDEWFQLRKTVDQMHGGTGHHPREDRRSGEYPQRVGSPSDLSGRAGR